MLLPAGVSEAGRVRALLVPCVCRPACADGEPACPSRVVVRCCFCVGLVSCVSLDAVSCGCVSFPVNRRLDPCRSVLLHERRQHPRVCLSAQTGVVCEANNAPLAWCVKGHQTLRNCRIPKTRQDNSSGEKSRRPRLSVCRTYSLIIVGLRSSGEGEAMSFVRTSRRRPVSRLQCHLETT